MILILKSSIFVQILCLMEWFEKKIIKISAILCIAACLAGCSDRDRYVTIRGYAQGGTFAVKYNAAGVHVKDAAVQATVDSLLTAIDNSLSGYNKGSLLSRFNAGEEIVPDDLFSEMYAAGYNFWKATDGALDVAAGRLFDLWGFGFANDSLPSDEAVEQAKALSGMKRLRPLMGAERTDNRSILVEGEDPEHPASLNFNAIAQGYSCDVIARYLHSIGVKDMLVDIGEIYCCGHNPSGNPWTIGVDRPVDGNMTPGADLSGILEAPEGGHGIVTSGNYRKYYVRDGKKYAHTIDPRTGRPVEHNLLSATIIARDGLTADAIATYCMVIGMEEAMEFIGQNPEIEGYLIYDTPQGMETWSSEGFKIKE